uniref:Uncharacterized protein n=1 Tax=Tanacetum cinerariifolium TaxID=118510 RepID=A0A699K4S6_TANCI|nr:hypothetical protein [Tanacetum cinerariifolium]
MTKINKKQYIDDVRVMNYLLHAIPNDIYNSVDTCKTAQKCGNELKAKEGESLEYVYEILTTLLNIMDRNNVCPIPVSINTKLSRGVTRGFSRRQAYNRNDAISSSNHQKFSTPTNNRLRTSSNTKNQAVIQDGRVDIQTKTAGYVGNANMNAGKQNMNQVFNAGNGSNQNDEKNDFMLDNSFRDETLEELTAAVIMMARIQPADENAMTEPTYYEKAFSEVNALHKMIPTWVHEHKNHGKH